MMCLILLFLCLSLLSGCSDEGLSGRDIYLVTVADDFYGWNGSSHKLENVITDQAALTAQFSTLGDVKITAFISQDGQRYVSETPCFIPVDKDGAELEDASDPAFCSFSYQPREGEMRIDWDMKDVLDTLATLPAGGNDLVIFCYSGHGEEDSGSLITNASQDSDTYDSMGVGNILDTLESLGGLKLAFIDSCYSGYFLPVTGISSCDVFGTDNPELWMYSSHLWSLAENLTDKAVSTERENVWVMSSANAAQEASDGLDYEDSRFQTSYGGFTYYLLKALGYDGDRNQARKKEGRITFYGLYDAIRKNFPETECAQQTPQVSLKALDVVLQ